jgi:hypothetical protein
MHERDLSTVTIRRTDSARIRQACLLQHGWRVHIGAQYLTAQYLQLVLGLSPLAEMRPPQPPEQPRQVSDAICRVST